MKIARSRFVLIALACVIIAVVAYAWWYNPVVGVLLPRYETGQFVSGGSVVVKVESEDVQGLLIGLIDSTTVMDAVRGLAPVVPQEPVYSYRYGAGNLEAASLEEWNRATGPVASGVLDKNFRDDRNLIHWDVPHYRVTFSGKPLNTTGKYVLNVLTAPDGQYMSVISAKGRPIRFGFRGSLYPRGPYYQETFERLTGRKVGQTYSLAVTRKNHPAPDGTWTNGNEYIVYRSIYGQFLWVVPGPNLTGPEISLNQGSAGE